jgi:hypothetical protein
MNEEQSRHVIKKRLHRIAFLMQTMQNPTIAELTPGFMMTRMSDEEEMILVFSSSLWL